MEPVPHIPVLIDAIIERAAPVEGVWIDGTFGAGGYTRALLAAGASHIYAVDRDPLAFELAESWIGPEITPCPTTFSKLDTVVEAADGVVLDLGVSSMQLDRAERGFSFMRDGPLDMRMSQDGPSAADLVAEASEEELADILYHYGEERASRRIARAIVKARVEPIETTARLVEIIESQLPRPKPGQSHPATRSFQALRIAVNAEYRELTDGLMAAERVLKPGGVLAVVTFHSVEDRIVKRFLHERMGKAQTTSRYAPLPEQQAAAFEAITRKAINASDEEREANPRSRSAKLRMARRTEVPAGEVDIARIGRPMVKGERP